MFTMLVINSLVVFSSIFAVTTDIVAEEQPSEVPTVLSAIPNLEHYVEGQVVTLTYSGANRVATSFVISSSTCDFEPESNNISIGQCLVGVVQTTTVTMTHNVLNYGFTLFEDDAEGEIKSSYSWNPPVVRNESLSAYRLNQEGGGLISLEFANTTDNAYEGDALVSLYRENGQVFTYTVNYSIGPQGTSQSSAFNISNLKGGVYVVGVITDEGFNSPGEIIVKWELFVPALEVSQ